jgi:serine protease
MKNNIKNIFWWSLVMCVSLLNAQSAVARDALTKQLILRMAGDGTRHAQSIRARQVLADVRLPDGTALHVVRRLSGDANEFVVRLPAAVSQEKAGEIARQIAADPGILSAEPDRRRYPALVPNDPGYLGSPPNFINQWNLFEDAGGIRMQEGWDLTTGSSAVTIALLDTGILEHRDLNPARIQDGYDFISDPDTANDGDGRDPDPTDAGDAVAADECSKGSPADDSSWHGLTVAGIMVAESDNNLDIAGIDFSANLLPVRVLGKCGGLVSDIVDAIRWSVGLHIDGVPDNPSPAKVVNLSLSGSGNCSSSEQRAINDAIKAGAVVVVAAGNENVDVATQSPANCDNVIVVGATNRSGSRASYTNFGEQIDLSAPGGESGDGLLTLSNNGQQDAGRDIVGVSIGTSYTTAQVSAVASLMFSLDATLTPDMVEGLLRQTTRAFPDSSCTTSSCGSGILDALAVLTGALDPVSILGATANTGKSSDGSGGGGGCSMSGNRSTDPFLLLLLFAGLAGITRRRLTEVIRNRS